MTLRLTLIDDEGNVQAWDRPYVEDMPGVSKDPASVLWGNVALLAGIVARERGGWGNVSPGEGRMRSPQPAGIDAA